MAALPPSDALTDDEWQEIDADTFSVVSFSTEVEGQDEDDGFEAQELEGRPSVCGTSTTLVPLRPRQADTSTHQSDDLVGFDNDNNKDDGEDDNAAVTQVDPSRPKRHSAQEVVPDWAAASPSADQDAELNVSASGSTQVADTSTCPAFLHKFITANIRLINSILALSSGHTRLKGLDQLPNLAAWCESLKVQLTSLAPIANGYAMHWQPERNSGGSPLPLDPGLHDWLSRLRAASLSIEMRLRQALGGSQYDSPQVVTDADVEEYVGVLTDLWAQMAAFLPIIEADFDEFHTAEMTFQSLVEDDDTQRIVKSQSPPPSQEPPASPSALRRHQSTHSQRQQRPGPSDAMFQLRRELYALKDQIAEATDELKYLQQLQQVTTTINPSANSSNGGSGSISANTADLDHTDDSLTDSVSSMSKALSALKTTLERILSNHPSDWLDSSTTGGLTYAEFSRIRPDTICSLRAELRRVTEDMFLERCRLERLAWTVRMSDPGGSSSSDKAPLIDGSTAAERDEGDDDVQMRLAVTTSHLQSLQAIHDVVAPMFRVDSRQ
ncbi:hypothetical protein MN608_06806 [Microdochium nivale]|nr:hypothetical protein MN608_06806 [Microdochium nivale]